MAYARTLPLDRRRAGHDDDGMQRSALSSLHPPIEPYSCGHLDVPDGHRLYLEECGAPDGLPVVILHGGPGGGINPTMRRFHDPRRHRIVLFDQRGCGRSTPKGSLDANTTWDLVADMELIRTQLGIERWQIFGGSWGSTLALAYAEQHPSRVTGLVLRGVFLLRRAELDWFYQTGARWLFPEAYKALVDGIPPAERGDLIRAFHARVTGPDPVIALAAARAWTEWESTTLSLVPDRSRRAMFPDADEALAFARIETHYFINGGFFRSDTELLDNIWRIRHLPCAIIQGRYDVVTPMQSALDLASEWPRATLEIIEDAGHAMTEPGIAAALVRAGRLIG
jgi:proline iminopeptidase